MNGISCDECNAGYKPGMVKRCDRCGGEFCGDCLKNGHSCKRDEKY